MSKSLLSSLGMAGLGAATGGLGLAAAPALGTVGAGAPAMLSAMGPGLAGTATVAGMGPGIAAGLGGAGAGMGGMMGGMQDAMDMAGQMQGMFGGGQQEQGPPPMGQAPKVGAGQRGSMEQLMMGSIPIPEAYSARQSFQTPGMITHAGHLGGRT